MSTRLRTGLALLLGLLALAFAPPASANVDDFSYASWESEYVITVDERGRAHAHVTETLVARFPDHDQNRGIVRGLHVRYQGASLHTEVVSVTDENGAAVPYETERADGLLYLLLGDDEFQHGLTTYVIEYTMRDVILAATATGNDEFYWNMLPLRSTQPIESFAGHVTFSPELSAVLTDDVACYQGVYDSRTPCTVESQTLGDGSVRYSTTGEDFAAGYGVTVAVGLRQSVVAQPPSRGENPLTDVVPFALLGGGAAAALGSGIAWGSFRRRRRNYRGVIVAQYDVPDQLPPLLAGAVYPGARDVLPAEIVHLAVRGILRIEERDDKTLRPRLRLLQKQAPDPLDERMIAALFPGGAVDDVITMPRSSESFAKRMQEAQAAGKREVEKRGLVERARSTGARILLAVTLLLSLAAVALAVVGVVFGREDAGPKLILTVIVGAVVTSIAFAFGARHRVHSRQGAEAYEYLAGVREFIRVAEADRLRMLQSHHGAERYREGGAEIVHLYERLLPYAMLFGEEKSWGRVLEVVYAAAQTQPVWMSHTAATGFSQQLTGFTSGTRSASTYASSSSSSGGGSSSFGGSTGGGFSGGGGGGGFSGGR